MPTTLNEVTFPEFNIALDDPSIQPSCDYSSDCNYTIHNCCRKVLRNLYDELGTLKWRQEDARCEGMVERIRLRIREDIL